VLHETASNEYKLDEKIGTGEGVFIDIGSNLGVALIMMARLHPPPHFKSSITRGHAGDVYLPAH
jgi:hypothetical protein